MGHVAVTLSDLSVSVPWYTRLIGAEPVLDEDTGPFRHELEKWQRQLDELGIEHSDIVDAGYGSGLAFEDPDGIALEFFAPPSA